MGEKNKCQKCGHEWIQRKQGRPVRCPVCQSVKWDNYKKKEVKE